MPSKDVQVNVIIFRKFHRRETQVRDSEEVNDRPVDVIRATDSVWVGTPSDLRDYRCRWGAV